MIEAQALTIGYPGKVVAGNIAFRVEPGQALVVLGPNGAGKTTLLRTLLGLNAPLAGRVLLDGRDTRTLSRREQARWLAYVPQARRFEFAFRVRDLVAMGSAPRLSTFALPGAAEYARADRALERLGIAHLADIDEPNLSGGEQQLVLLARALVQDTKLLLLDEPTANLDFANQNRVLAQVDALVRSGLGVIMISHSPAHAFACGTHAALFGRGGRFAVGTVDALLTEERLSAVYEVGVRIVSVSDERGTLRTCIPDPGAR